MSAPPLAGFTVAVTADRLRTEQVELLRRRGLDVIEGPAIRTLPLVDSSDLRGVIHDLVESPPDITVLLTGLGVRSLLSAAESISMGDALVGALSESMIVARGPKAAGAAMTAGLEVSWRAPGERGSEVVEHLELAARRGARIAVQRDGGSDPYVADALREIGGDVVDVCVYAWSVPDDPVPALRVARLVADERVDAVTFTSAPAVRNFFTIANGLHDGVVAGMNGSVVTAAVGPVAAEALLDAGVTAPLVPARSRLGSMVQALAAELERKARVVHLAGRPVRLQGAVAVIDGEAIRLTEREREVLDVLVGAGGAVVPKRLLLRDQTDEHAVEVVVGRLRRRLGPAADAIRTVPRRGYRLHER